MDLVKYWKSGKRLKKWSRMVKNCEADIIDIANYLEEDVKEYTPSNPKMILRPFTLTPPEDVKVVIVGQDPYYTKGTADGLCFSMAGQTPVNSLLNIFKAVKHDYPDDFIMPSNGSLRSWAVQGVLLINKSFTTKLGEANHHPYIYMGIISEIIAILTERDKKIIWLLWGANAQELSSEIGQKGVIIKACHPSPRNVQKGGIHPFINSGHFKLTNQELEKQGKIPINWLSVCES